MRRQRYVQALSFRWLTGWYDPLMRWTMPEAAFKRRLIEQADIADGHRVLDLGCGTGTMTIEIKRAHRAAEVIGLDGDRAVLAIASRKGSEAGVEITWHPGMSFELPYEGASFDRVLSSLLFHHLSRADKLRTFTEIHRVLRPGGSLHVADWGKPSGLFMRAAFLSVQCLDGFATTGDNAAGRLGDLIGQGGFQAVQQTDRFNTIFGTLVLLRAGVIEF